MIPDHRSSIPTKPHRKKNQKTSSVPKLVGKLKRLELWYCVFDKNTDMTGDSSHAKTAFSLMPQLVVLRHIVWMAWMLPLLEASLVLTTQH